MFKEWIALDKGGLFLGLGDDMIWHEFKSHRISGLFRMKPSGVSFDTSSSLCCQCWQYNYKHISIVLNFKFIIYIWILLDSRMNNFCFFHGFF